ncbi:EcsC family protein [Streptomyces scopuliridis]|uniref:EcsC family protein n=1 Tax=Streptomyces scopuliridis TaxID=452529 RepID=A0ACD4ZFQ1_9ACTN|nr:hypothetical protein [Streptomyces scopuliridis]WSB32957.1 EcsC family protein [Streptomyces scopuliridis]WSB97214.1 EcsC family protein [Streptomyces scopuliridis]WSC09082.1 EcsC family protein [Streptomyces scopuliridis]
MAGDTPFRKRRFRRKGSPEVYEGGTGPAEGVQPAAEHSALSPRSGAGDDERGRPASLEAVREDHGGPKTGGRRLDTVKRGVRRGGDSAKAALAHLADRIIENAPRVPVRDLATLRKQFPGLGPEELADKLVAGAANSTSTVGAGIGAAAMMPVPPAMPAELAAEITAVAAIELKLIAELHEVYGLRPSGTLRERSAAYLTSWTEERGVDITRPSTFNGALSGRMKRELRQQIMKRTVRSLPNLVPFMIGAAVGAMMNRRDTKKVAERIRKDLRARQIPWDTLHALPRLERPTELPAELPRELGH